MAYIILPHKLTRQPTFVPTFDARFASRLQHVFLPTLRSVNIGQSKGNWTENSALYGASKEGTALLKNGTSSYVLKAVGSLPPDFTVLTAFVMKATAATSGLAQIAATVSSGAPYFLMQANDAEFKIYYGHGYLVTESSAFSNGNFYTVAGAVAGSKDGYAFRNGKQSGADWSVSGTDSGSDLYIGNGYSGSADIQTVLAAYWNRRLTKAELAELTANPWSLFAPLQRRIYVGPSAAGGTTVPLSGLAATGAVGSLALTHKLTLSGLAATGAVGTLSPSSAVSVSLSGLAATGAVGTLSLSRTLQLTGLAATGAVGSVTPSVGAGAALSGLEATGAVGLLAPSHSVALSGLAATGAVGTLTPTSGLVVALSGLAATGAVGTFAPKHAVALSGLAATGAVGSLGISTPVNITLTGLEATGAVGILSVGPQTILVGGGGGHPFDYHKLKRQKSTIERTREILDEVEEEMREAVTGEPLEEVLKRPLDAAAIAAMITPRPERRDDPFDDDDDMLLLTY